MNTLQFAETTPYYTTTTTGVDETTAAAFTVGIVLFTLLISLASYIVTAIFLGKIFKKAGIASWIAWVPFYNTWKLLEIGGQPGFWSVLAIVPIVNYVSAVFMYIAMYNIGLKLGKSGAFVLLAIFIPIVWIIWLAVDKSTWNETLGAPSKAVEHTAPVAPTPPTTPTV